MWQSGAQVLWKRRSPRCARAASWPWSSSTPSAWPPAPYSRGCSPSSSRCIGSRSAEEDRARSSARASAGCLEAPDGDGDGDGCVSPNSARAASSEGAGKLASCSRSWKALRADGSSFCTDGRSRSRRMRIQPMRCRLLCQHSRHLPIRPEQRMPPVMPFQNATASFTGVMVYIQTFGSQSEPAPNGS